MENPLLLFPQLNISASKDKPYYKLMKSAIKEEPHKASKPGAKQKRNRLSLLLQKPEFHEGDHLGKPGNLTKAASSHFQDQAACFDQSCFYKPFNVLINEHVVEGRFFEIKHVQLDILDEDYEEFYKRGTVYQNNMAFEMFVVNKPDYTVSPEEAVKWGESFDKLLSEKAGLDAFTKFLKTEFSEENIEFWIACEDYKKSKSAHELLPKAKTIFETFIQKDAPKEVNLDFHTKEVTSQSMGQPLRSTFDAAQSTVYRLMEQDSYPRFLRSAPYLGLLQGRLPARAPLRRRSRSFTVSDFQGVRPDLTMW